MAETSKLFRLNVNDLVKGAATAIVAGVVLALASVVNQSGFDVLTVNWSEVLSTAINAGTAALVGYLGKNFLSNSDGAVLGKFGGSQK